MTQFPAESPAVNDHEIIRSMVSSKDWEVQLAQAREQRAKVLAEHDSRRQRAGSLTSVPLYESLGQLPRSVQTTTRSLVLTPAIDLHSVPHVEKAPSLGVSAGILAGVLFISMIGVILSPITRGLMHDILNDRSRIPATQGAALASSDLLIDSQALTPAPIDALKEIAAWTIRMKERSIPAALSFGKLDEVAALPRDPARNTFPLGATVAVQTSKTDDEVLPIALKVIVSPKKTNHLPPTRALRVSSLLLPDNDAPRVSTLAAQTRLMAIPAGEQRQLQGGTLVSSLTNTINAIQSALALAPIGEHDRAPQPSAFNHIKAADTYRVHLHPTEGPRLQTAQVQVRKLGFAIAPLQPKSFSESETVAGFYHEVSRQASHALARHRAGGTMNSVGAGNLFDRKNEILSTLLIACVTSASADTKMGGCDLILREGSNECGGESAGNCGKVKVAPLVMTAGGVPATFKGPQDVLAPEEVPTLATPELTIAGPSEVEEPAANEPSSEPPASDNLGSEGADADSDHDSGHGNDAGGVDPSNPGQGNEQGSTDKPNGDNGHGNDGGDVEAGNPGQGDKQSGSEKPNGDNDHGNDAGGADQGNPGQGDKQGGSDKPEGGKKGHGNDADGSDTGDQGDGGDNGRSDKD